MAEALRSDTRSTLAGRLGVALFLLAAVLWGAWIRIDTTLRDPDFDAADARGILRSDPALLLYLSERIVAAGGGLPEDFRAERRLQHPFVTDVPAEFPIGQEFLVAWTARTLFPDTPLHVVALYVMSCVAACFVLGVYLAARAATGRVSCGLLAVLLALVTPANYRTIGFLMVGEDLALPLFVLHLGLTCAALRARSAWLHAASGLALAAALSTWHALSFVLLLELGLVFLWALVTGRSPLAERAARWVLAAPLLAGLVVPVLVANGLLVSPAAALAAALLVGGLGRVGSAGAGRVRLVLAGVAGVALVAGSALAPSSYDHVRAVVLAKLAHFGQLPLDPRELCFDARLLWQGPFETLAPPEVLAWCGVPLALLFVASLVRGVRAKEWKGADSLLLGLALLSWPAAWILAFAVTTLWGVVAAGSADLVPWVPPQVVLGWAGVPLVPVFAVGLVRAARRNERSGAELLLLALALLALPAAWMFGRLAALVGLFVPGAAVLALAGARRPWLAWSVAGALLAAQAFDFARYLGEHEIDWYPPKAAREELAALVEWVRAEVPRDEPIVSDFVNSTALLAHTGNPIVLQPKYETDRSRRAAEAFLTTFFRGSCAELAELLATRFESRYLLVDARMLWDQSRYTAGLGPEVSAPLPGTAAEALLSDDDALLRALAEFELLYRGRSDLAWCDYRVFRRR